MMSKYQSFMGMLITVAAIGTFFALSISPLSLVVIVSGSTTAILLTVIAARQTRTHRRASVGATLLLLTGFVLLALDSTTEQLLTAPLIHERFTRFRVLQHLLLCLVVMIAIVVWIHESYYSFATTSSGSPPLAREWARKAIKAMQCVDHTEESLLLMRTKAFAVLSAIAGACSLLSEKCVAELFRTSTDTYDISPSILSSTLLLVVSWSAMGALEAYWWEHALSGDAFGTRGVRTVYRPYLSAWISLGVLKGVLFFDELRGKSPWLAGFGMLLVFAGLYIIPLPDTTIMPTEDLDPSVSGLVDATQALLDNEHEQRIEKSNTITNHLPNDSSRVDTDTYRPPAYFLQTH